MTDFFSPRYLTSFDTRSSGHIFSDVVVLGSGIAGVFTALELSKYCEVTLISKGDLNFSNSFMAQGGIAAVLAKEDEFKLHVEDTLKAGAGLCFENSVEKVVSESPNIISKLEEIGVQFDEGVEGTLSLGREGGHSKNRIVHGDGDATGKAVMRALIQNLQKNKNIRCFDHCFAIDLIVEENKLKGVFTHHPKYGYQFVWCQSLVLASGGAGQVFRESTNFKGASGDGIAMAWRAGALLADLEFVQFHPTTLYFAGACRHLITEAVRGEGASLVNQDGQQFMKKYHELEDLAPRDIVSRAILNELKVVQNGQVFLDITQMGIEYFSKRFPNIFKVLEGLSLDLSQGLIPVRPSAHYMIGGLVTNLNGKTSIEGLWACGEVASTGLHGANRLASNSLLEGLVMGQQCAEDILKKNQNALKQGFSSKSHYRKDPISWWEVDISDMKESIKSLMWRYVGVERNKKGLDRAKKDLIKWSHYFMDFNFNDPIAWQIQNMMTVAWLISNSAHLRGENIGTHFLEDGSEKHEKIELLHSFIKETEFFKSDFSTQIKSL